MILKLPDKLYDLAKALPRPLYVVGGACRDALCGLKNFNPDWDICAPLDWERFAAAAEGVGFKVKSVYKNTGTVHLTADGKDFEYTSFRSDKYVRGHIPSEVEFTDDIEKDALRRDFKCNAVYYDILRGEFCDPLWGIEDIRNRAVSTVASPDKVFAEDGLRLMRLCRIAASIGFTPTEECICGAERHSALICDIAPERIWAELKQILICDLKYNIRGAQYNGVELLKRTGVLRYILPELWQGDGMAQRPDFHDHDVLEHSLRCVLYADKSIRLAALLHDVGKPYCYINYGRFHGHEVEGERIFLEIMRRFKAPNRQAEHVSKLIRWHMYDLDGRASANKIKKFIVRNPDIIGDLLLLKQADFSACKDVVSKAPGVARWEGIIGDMKRDNAPFVLKQLDINGSDLISCGICADQIGKTLQFLLEQSAMGCVENKREKLLKAAVLFNGARRN